MPNAVITISSAGISPIANLNWRGGKATTATVTTTASSLSFTVEFAMTDPQLVGGTSLATWWGVSSNTYSVDTAGATTFAASGFTSYVYIPFPGPIAALRINCSSNSGSAAITMQVLQGEGW